jgi:hypothetical protein
MTSFVHPYFPSEHRGATRAANVAENVQSAFDGVRGIATLLLAAVVSAVMMMANRLIDTWSSGHLFGAWVVLWTVAFAALVLFAAPLRRLSLRTRTAVRAFREHSHSASEDHKLWELALADARVMADISRAMKQGAPTKVAFY